MALLYMFIAFLDTAFHSYGLNFSYSHKTEIFRSAVTTVATPNSVSQMVLDVRNEANQEIKDARASTSYAVILNTFKRPYRLRKTTQHYAKTCGKKYGISSVYIVWGDVSTPPPSASSLFDPEQLTSEHSTVHIIRVDDPSMNSRFSPINGLKETAVFMVDDDVEVDCLSLSHGFEAWISSPLSLVGYYPRIIERKRNGEYAYRVWPVVYLKNTFNLVLPTKAAFMHSKYLAAYSGDSHPQEIKDMVNRQHNCEDIAMAFLISNATQYLPGSLSHPIFVEGNVWDYGLFSGISLTINPSEGFGKKHLSTRSDCINELIKIYEENEWGFPLPDLKLTDRLWLRHFPGFWWQTRSSNIFEWVSVNVFMALYDHLFL